MRAILTICVLAFSGSAAFAAETYDDPKALVNAIYEGYRPGQLASDPAAFYSKRLADLFAQSIENGVFEDPAAMAGEEVGASAPFNPFLPDSSALLFDLVVGEPARIDDRAVVNVSYHNFDQPRLLSIAMVQEDGGWKVDDVASMGNEDHWLLSWVLAYDPQGTSGALN